MYIYIYIIDIFAINYGGSNGFYSANYSTKFIGFISCLLEPNLNFNNTFLIDLIPS